MSSITALKSVMLTNFFSHHCLSGIRIGAASDIDPGFGSPRMYPGHSVPTALHPGWTCMLQTLSLCIHLADGISFFVDFFSSLKAGLIGEKTRFLMVQFTTQFLDCGVY